MAKANCPKLGLLIDRFERSDHVSAPQQGGLLNRRAAADFLGVSERLLERKAVDGTGPVYVRISTRRLGYRPRDLEAWLDARTFPHRAAELAKAVAP